MSRKANIQRLKALHDELAKGKKEEKSEAKVEKEESKSKKKKIVKNEEE